jgi:magnesium transporter
MSESQPPSSRSTLAWPAASRSTSTFPAVGERPTSPDSIRRRNRAVGEPEPGAMPGTLNIAEGPPPRIYVMDYSLTHVTEKEIQSIDDVVTYLEDEIDSITWVDIQGIRNRETFERVGQIFGVHALALEDVVNVPQRPHTDVYPNQQLIISRMLQLGADGGVVTEQLGIIFGKGYVLTIQEESTRDCLENVRNRIRNGRAPVRRFGADYLAYAVLDAVVDGFYPALEAIGDRLDQLEAIATNAKRSLSHEIHDVKRDLLDARRAIWPQRDVVNALLRDDSPHISPSTRIYLKDTYDHAVQVMDMVETFREVASGIMDLYLSGVSQRMNEVMKVLTVISTIFMPITFIAGIYGMNFNPDASPFSMPELNSRYGYPIALLGMASCIVAMLIIYRRKGWLGGR